MIFSLVQKPNFSPRAQFLCKIHFDFDLELDIPCKVSMLTVHVRFYVAIEINSFVVLSMQHVIKLSVITSSRAQCS